MGQSLRELDQYGYLVTDLGYGANAVALSDLNNDGALDMVATTGGGNTVSVLLGDGQGGFGIPTNYPVGSNPVSIAIGDLDKNGGLDIVVANWYSYYVSVLLGDASGRFQPAINYSFSRGSNFATLADLDKDGWLDMLVANNGAASISIMKGLPPDTTPPSGGIAINQGAQATSSLYVTLNLSAQDTGCGVASMAFSNDGITYSAFEPYASAKSWTLPAGDGPKTVYAIFKDAAGNLSQPVSAAILLDQIAPTGGVTIDGGADFTSDRLVALDLSASDTGSGVAQMWVTDGASASNWVNYSASYAWTLPTGDGTKTIRVYFRDVAGNLSAVVTDTIVLDTQPPTAAVAPLEPYQPATFAVALSGSDTLSGVASYDVQVRDGAAGAWADWQTGTASTSLTFAGAEGHTYAFRVRARDKAGNLGAFSAGDVQTTVDTLAPEPGWLLISGGALDTTSPTVTLSVYATDSASGLAAMSFSNDGSVWGAWRPYAAAAAWSIGAGDGQKTVYARFRDAAGNVSAAISDTIVLDTQASTDYGLTINDGALFTNSAGVDLTISAQAGTTQMQVSNDGGFFGVAWQPYSAHKAWQITQYGVSVLPRIVYVRFKDANGSVTSTFQDDIILDMTPPVGAVRIVVPAGAQLAAAGDVTLLLSATDDLSGVGEIR